MSANKMVIVSVSLYVTLCIVLGLLFLSTKFTGDPAGSGMAKGLTFLYGLIALFVIALALTIFNAFSFKNITLLWVKVLFFLPLLLPLLVFLGSQFIPMTKFSNAKEQDYKLTMQLKASMELNKPKVLYRSSERGTASRLKYIKTAGDFYFYESSMLILAGNNRTFYVNSNQFKTQEYQMEIPFEPASVPYTDWVKLTALENKLSDSLKLEFRYKITQQP